MPLLTTRVTSLEMREKPRTHLLPPRTAEPLSVRAVTRMPLAEYRALYRELGEPHHWTSRLLSDERLAKEIHGEQTRLFVLRYGEKAAGWFELEVRREIREARIVHFGILPGYRRRGFANYLLDEAIMRAFAEGIDRLTIETNTLDHPAALPLYQKHGFSPYAVRQVRTPSIDTASARLGRNVVS